VVLLICVNNLYKCVNYLYKLLIVLEKKRMQTYKTI